MAVSGVGWVREFAAQYVALVEALQQQGVPEDKAREEARVIVTSLVILRPEPGQICKLCGSVWEED